MVLIHIQQSKSLETTTCFLLIRFQTHKMRPICFNVMHDPIMVLMRLLTSNTVSAELGRSLEED